MKQLIQPLVALTLVAGVLLSSGCNSITANYHDPAQEATLYPGTQRILSPRNGQMKTVGSLPDAIDLPFTIALDTVLIPLNLLYILTGYEPNVPANPEPEPPTQP